MKRLSLFFGGILLVIHSHVTAQNHTLQLVDFESHKPIVDATFQYADQYGISDENGYIQLDFIEKEILFLSHVNYGSWSLSETELKEAIAAQKIFRKQSVNTLLPFTVISLRDPSKTRNSMPLAYSDKLSHDGGAVLKQSAAISGIRKSGSYGFDPVLRGFKYDQLNIVLDGAQCASAACPNRMDPPTSQMAPNTLDKIEIIKGPHALRYGNSFGGTINYVSGAEKFSNSPQAFGRFSTGYETNGEIWQSEGMVGFRQKSINLRLFGSYGQGVDYTDGEGNTLPAAFSRISLGAKLGVKINDKNQVLASATRNIAKDVDFPALPMDLRNDDTWLVNATHIYSTLNPILSEWKTMIYATLVDHEMDNLGKSISPRMLNAVTTANTLNYGGRTESIWNLSKGKLFAGADYRYEAAEGTRTREMLMGPMQGNTLRDNVWQDSYIQKAGLFGEYQLQKGAVTYQAGFRFNFNYAGMQNPAPEFENVSNTSNTTQLNPSISLGLQHEVSGSLIWGVWLGSAQRSGSLAERYINFFPIGQDPYEMVGNPDLDPERNHELDVNLSISRKTWRMQVNGYASVVQNYISSLIDTTLAPRMPSSPGVRYFTNLDLAFRTGFEVSFTHNLPLKLHQQLELAYGIGQDLETTFPLPEIAPLDARYSLYGSYFKDRFVPKLRLRYVAEQNRIAEEFGETKTPDFFTVDLHLALVSKSFLRVNFGVNNLFDVGYYEHLNRSVRGSMQPIFEPGRSFILSLTFDFSNPQKVRK